MIVELKQLNGLLKEAKKLGVKGKKAIVKIYKDENENSFVQVFKEDMLYQSPISAQWKPKEKDKYLISFTDVLDLMGILELTLKEVKIINGETESTLRLAGYEDLQNMDFITEPYASKEVKRIKATTNVNDLKLAESLVKVGELISIRDNFIFCSPNLQYGGYVIPTEHNTDTKFVVSKHGIKVLEDCPNADIVIGYSTTDNQTGAQIRTNRYILSEKLDTVKRQPNKVPGKYEAVSNVLIDEFKKWDEQQIVSFIPPIDFIDYVISLDTELARYITFTGSKDSKTVHVKIGDDVDIQTTFHTPVPLKIDLALRLDMKLAEPYFKNLKKYGGYMEYRPSSYMCQFKYTKRIFSGFLLGLKMREVR